MTEKAPIPKDLQIIYELRGIVMSSAGVRRLIERIADLEQVNAALKAKLGRLLAPVTYDDLYDLDSAFHGGYVYTELTKLLTARAERSASQSEEGNDV